MSLLYCGDLPIHWLPPTVAVTEDVLKSTLSRAEWEQSSCFGAESRRQEFRRSRYLYHRLTGSTESLLQHDSGAPKWPEGWVGSITHKSGFIGIVLVASKDWLSVGIDAEDPSRMSLNLAQRICTPTELENLREWGRTLRLSDCDILTAIFSFKESLFKAHYPIGHRLFYFYDCEVTGFRKPDDPTNTSSMLITAQLKNDTTPLTLKGTIVAGNLIIHQSDERRFFLTGVAWPR